MKMLSVNCLLLGVLALMDQDRPVSKVVNLLKDMQNQLEKEAEEDEEVYDKMACWCSTYDKETTQNIKDAQDKISQLTNNIENYSANSARLNAEIANLKDEVAADEKALDEATTLRRKQLAEFNAEERDALQAVSALKAAITVLSKHNSSFLQQDLKNVAQMLEHQMRKFAGILNNSITPSDKRIIREFIQAPAGYQSYSSQSGQIFGILQNMLETFQANLSNSQKEEQANQKAFDEFKGAKENEITNGNNQIDEKTEDLGTNDENLAQAKQDLKDTRATLSADEQFLLDLKQKCQMTDQEWEARQKTRQDEIAAVSQAIQILDGDEAHATFSSTYEASFVQTSNSVHQKRRNDASAILASTAEKTQDPKLMQMANSVKLANFTRVKKAIDDMVANLLKEKSDEIKLRDWCIDATNENERNQSHNDRDMKDLDEQIKALQAQIKTLTDDIDTLQTKTTDLKKEMKEEGENREKEHNEFQKTIADQRASRTLLQKALKVLEGFYAKKAFLQKAGPASPAGFNEYENNAGGNTVLNLLKTIITETNTMEQETTRDENTAQSNYEKFVAESNKTLELYKKEIVNKTEEKSNNEGELSDSNDDMQSKRFDEEELNNESDDIKKRCDFVVNNFDARQAARDSEVEALRQAKDILSGSDFNKFLQRSE